MFSRWLLVNGAKRSLMMRKGNWSGPVAEMRKITGLSQLEFGTKAGVTQRQVSLWEQGKVSPNLKSLIRLADIHGLMINITVEVK